MLFRSPLPDERIARASGQRDGLTREIGPARAPALPVGAPERLAAPLSAQSRHLPIARAPRRHYRRVTRVIDARTPDLVRGHPCPCVPTIYSFIYNLYVVPVGLSRFHLLVTTHRARFAWDRGRLARSRTNVSRGRLGNVTASRGKSGRRGRRRSQWGHQSASRCLSVLNRDTFRGSLGEIVGTHDPCPPLAKGTPA